MIKDILKKYKHKMKYCVNLFLKSILKIRTGRISPNILNEIYIDYYGVKTLISKISNILVKDSNTLKINAFDNSLNKLIEKSIIKSNLGLNPIIINNSIIVPIPSLTQERRQELLKLTKQESEKYKILIRNLRRDVNNLIKKKLKNKIISENEEKLFQKKNQNFTDFYIDEINNNFLKKEKEIMSL
ncbi:ribosome recycling factor [Buchnera aphidicola]|uniref:ribosome recycling factor n=1 Tax=Buchnera aphidicola TaxID=9 RepID=UPI0030EE5348